MSTPKRPKPFAVGKVRVRIHSGPREDGRWRWRADRYAGKRDGKKVRELVWSGWGDRDEAEAAVLEQLNKRGEGWTSRADVSTVEDLLAVWVADVELGDRSKYTSTSRRGCCERLVGSPLGAVRLVELDRPALQHHVVSHAGADSTLRTDMIALRAAWAWGRERSLVPDRELPRVRVRVQRNRGVYNRYTPTAEEVAQVLEQLRTRRSRPPLWPWRATYLLYATGCRAGEIATLTWARVDLQRCQLEVDGKNGPRTVAIHPRVAAELGTWEHHGHTVAGCRPDSVRGHLHNYITRACRELELKPWSLQGLRRLAVARLYRAGLDPSASAAHLGHSPTTALKHYREIAAQDLAGAVLRTGLGLLPGQEDDD